MNDATDRLDALVILGLLVMLGFVLWSLVFVGIPKDNMTLFASLSSGTVGLGIGSYLGYRFGSSKGSAAKDATITAMADKAANQ